MMFIPYGRQNISEDDKRAVIEVLGSDFLTQGSTVPNFERLIIDYTGARQAVAVSSATAALHLACLALELNQGDILWTSPNSFVASANCALYCGADIDFVDIDEASYNMCPDQLELKLKQASKVGRLPKIVIPVHFAGQSCDMEKIHRLAMKYDFKIIEDASHCIGGSYLQEKIGACQYSDICIFSFHPVKIITTGEGGIATTNDIRLANKMSALRTHGITRDQECMENDPHGPWYYEQLSLGYNYRMTDIQARLGISQMQRLDSFVKRRHEIAKQYDDLLKNLPLITPVRVKKSHSAMHLYVVQLIEATKRRFVFEYLREQGVGVNVHYIPIHLQPYYQNLGFKWGDFAKAENYYTRVISLPIFPDLTSEQQNYIVTKLGEALHG